MKISANIYGAAFMTISLFSFVSNDAIMKYLFKIISIEQGIFIRGLISVPLLVTIAIARKDFFVTITRHNWKIIIIRAFAELGATIAFLTALSKMPLANVTAILQSLPLTVTMFAAIFFGEKVGWRRWAAILIGFVGVIIIIRPGGEGFNNYAVLAVIAVGFVTLRDAITRRLDSSVPSLLVALTSSIPILVFGGGMTLTTGWTNLSASMYGMTIVAAVAITSGHLFAVMAMRNGDISFVAPFRYTAMLWAIIFGYLVFYDLPDRATIFGTLIIIGMGVYAFHRERVSQKLKR